MVMLNQIEKTVKGAGKNKTPTRIYLVSTIREEAGIQICIRPEDGEYYVMFKYVGPDKTYSTFLANDLKEMMKLIDNFGPMNLGVKDKLGVKSEKKVP